MNNGAFGENFPYSNFHDMNMDWIIKIAKDFLDQYTHIQEVITNGEESLQNLTTEGLEQLQTKADALETLLQQWYDTHSEDIEEQLRNALQDLTNTSEITLATFTQQANLKAAETLDTIPEDYSKLSHKVNAIIDNRNMLFNATKHENAYYDTIPHESTDYCYFEIPVISGTTYFFGRRPRFVSKSGELLANDPVLGFTYTANFTGTVYVSYSYASTRPWYVCLNSVDHDTVGSYNHATLNPGTLMQERGTDKSAVMSQWAVDQEFKKEDEVNTILFNVLNKKNLLLDTKVKHGYYYYNGGEHEHNDYAYATIELEANKTYVIGSYIRFLSTSTEDIIQSRSTDYEYTPTTDITIYVTFWYNRPNWYVYEKQTGVNSKNVGSYNQPALSPETLLLSKNRKNSIILKAEIMNDSDYLESPTISVKTGTVYRATFEADQMGEVRIGHGYWGGSNLFYTKLQITKRKWSVINYDRDEIILREWENDLTPDYYLIEIKVKNNHKADIHIAYPGDNYEYTDIKWVGDGLSCANIQSIGGTIKKVNFAWILEQARCPVYVFGDSYIHVEYESTWPYYYLHNWNNALFSGWGGARSETIINSLKNLITINKPTCIVWALGMNDGNDTDSTTPNATWLTYLNEFIELCENNGIEPILCTIPTTPTVYNEGKNYKVRDMASRYRIVDFANAVGADANGVWYQGMLSSDNTHPTNRGAFALFLEIISVVPEMCSNQ